MELEVERRPRATVIRFSGTWDAESRRSIRDQLAQLSLQGLTVVELSGAQMSDSTSQGVILGMLAMLDQRALNVRLVELRPGVRRVLEVTGLAARFPVYDALEESLGE